MKRLRESHIEFDGSKYKQCSYKLGMFQIATPYIFLSLHFLSYLIFSPYMFHPALHTGFLCVVIASLSPWLQMAYGFGLPVNLLL